MKLKTVFLMLVLLSAPTAFSQSLDPGPWPTSSHDNQRTSRSNLSGPSNPGSPTLLYDAGSPVFLGNITVTSDGKLLLSSCTPQVIALTTSGSPLGAPWPYSLISAGASGIPGAVGFTVSGDGHIYVPTHECPDIPGGVPARYHSIKSSGTSEANWPISSSAMYAAPAISTDGTILQMDEFNIIHAYRPDGSLLWSQGTAGFGQGDIALDSSDNIYVGTDGNIYGRQTVFSFTSTGAARPGWPKQMGTFATATTPTVGPGDIIYFADASGALYAFNSDGSLRAGFPFNAGGTVSNAPLALAASGTVYLKTSRGLFAINPDGTNAWASPFAPGGDASLSPSPVVDANGSIYVAFGDRVYSLDSTGNVRPGWPVTVPSTGEIVIGGDGVLYAASAGQKLYAIISGSSPIASLSGPPNPAQPFATTSEPINTATGNYYNQHVDFTVPGRASPLIFQRTYNSLASYAGLLGASWTHSFNIALSQDASANPTIRWGDGHSETYTATPSGYVPQPGVFSTLTKNSDGSFTLLTKDQRTYSFSLAGRLMSIRDRNGNMTALNYDSGGLLQSVIAAGGESLVFSYDSNNRISQVSDSIGRTVKFSYSSTDDLTQVIDAAGGITTYTYDASHRMLSATLPNGSVLLQNTYDPSGRVVAQTNGRGFTTTLAYNTPAQNQTTITDPLGNQTIHTYDTALRIVQITDAAGKNVSYSYDANNDRTSVTNQNGKATTFLYDSRGNVTGITDPLGNASSFAYDPIND